MNFWQEYYKRDAMPFLAIISEVYGLINSDVLWTLGPSTEITVFPFVTSKGLVGRYFEII
jgi:hypothetical protein